MAKNVQGKKETTQQAVVRNLKNGCRGAVKSIRVNVPVAIRTMIIFPSHIGKVFSKVERKVKSGIN